MSRNLKLCFDSDSGVQFIEKTCQVVPGRPEWTWKTLGSTQDITDFISEGQGCASLQDMAIRHLCRSIHYITPELLMLVPWSVGKVLWERIAQLKLDSFLLWKVFVLTYSDMLEVMNLARREQTLLNPKLNLSSYCTSINSPSLSWINILSLNDMDCSRQDLIGICNLNNLGLLKIGQCVNIYGNQGAGLDESIIRNWARAAAENNRFRHLRVLVLHGQQPLLDIVWDYLREFPVLSIVLTHNCKELVKRWQESRKPNRWPSLTDKQLRDYLAPHGLAKEDKSWNSLLYAAYCSGESFRTTLDHTKSSEKLAQSPMLQIAIGPNVIGRGNDFVSFRRVDLEGTRKRKAEQISVCPKQEKPRKMGLSKLLASQDIANVLEAFSK